MWVGWWFFVVFLGFCFIFRVEIDVWLGLITLGRVLLDFFCVCYFFVG
jgi:hypothetical protein